MSIENPTLAHFRHFSSLFTNLPSTIVENSLQIGPFMQNKPNFKIGKMNISIEIIKDYDKEQRTINNERCSKQTQNKPNSNRIQTQTKLMLK